MANSDKNILITPSTGQTSDPTIAFTGTNNTPVTITTLDDGSLVFEGSQGTLFSVSDDFSGTLFAASDISGIPGIDLDSEGLVRLAPYSGQVIIGSDDSSAKYGAANSEGIYANALQVKGSVFVDGETFFGGTTKGSFNLDNGHDVDITISTETANTAANTIVTPTGHGFKSGDKVAITFSAGGGFSPFSAQDYFVSYVNDTQFRLHNSYADGIGDQNRISFTAQNRTDAIANNTVMTVAKYSGVPVNTHTGTKGDIRVDDQYIYVCTATDTWKRVELNLASWS